MQLNTEPTISSQEIFSGRVFNIRVDKIQLPNGGSTTREIVEHNGGVGIIALDDNGYVAMVRQYRKGAEDFLLEIPAGKLAKGEDPLDCAKRELKEETGLTAETYTYLGSYFVSPAYDTEKIHIYLAQGLTQGEASLDPGEYLNAEHIHISDLVKMCLGGEITDGKTAIAILQLAARNL